MLFTQSRRLAKKKRPKVYRQRVTVRNKRRKRSGFSFGWVLASLMVFLVFQISLGYLAGQYVFGHYVAQHTRFLAEGLLVLVSYFLGAFCIGVASPHLRVAEPVVAAFLAILAAFSIVYFTPHFFYVASVGRIAIGSLLACSMAAAGVISGERLMGNL